VKDPVSHPYKTTGRIMVLYILTFALIAGRRTEDSEPNGIKRSPNLVCSESLRAREIRKQKKSCYVKCWKCPPRSATRALPLFMSDATRWRASAVTATGSPENRRTRKCTPKVQ
jgi:hypothetical protein